ncbi:MAG TPA: AAA family ATPase, partial [bacterium]|nr:AAA family ATPase [bacterium]HOL47892.1 AAA family ATPase [bacterium]HPQ19670.1 AAA family ATPase [bacterium]
MKPIAIDLSNFEEIIKGGGVYVDKTYFIYKIISSISKYYFLSRPRRFGKSLTVSTLKAIFEGKREL